MFDDLIDTPNVTVLLLDETFEKVDTPTKARAER